MKLNGYRIVCEFLSLYEMAPLGSVFLPQHAMKYITQGSPEQKAKALDWLRKRRSIAAKATELLSPLAARA